MPPLSQFLFLVMWMFPRTPLLQSRRQTSTSPCFSKRPSEMHPPLKAQSEPLGMYSLAHHHLCWAYEHFHQQQGFWPSFVHPLKKLLWELWSGLLWHHSHHLLNECLILPAQSHLIAPVGQEQLAEKLLEVTGSHSCFYLTQQAPCHLFLQEFSGISSHPKKSSQISKQNPEDA